MEYCLKQYEIVFEADNFSYKTFYMEEHFCSCELDLILRVQSSVHITARQKNTTPTHIHTMFSHYNSIMTPLQALPLCIDADTLIQFWQVLPLHFKVPQQSPGILPPQSAPEDKQQGGLKRNHCHHNPHCHRNRCPSHHCSLRV